jgi:hypothetical protein
MENSLNGSFVLRARWQVPHGAPRIVAMVITNQPVEVSVIDEVRAITFAEMVKGLVGAVEGQPQ